MAKGHTPEVINLSPAQLEELLVQLSALLPAKTYHLVEALLRTLQWLMELVQNKGITLARLQRVLFGFPTEKAQQILPKEPAADSTSEQRADSDPPPSPRKRRGHGRQPAHLYTGAEKIAVPHPHLSAGGPCPGGCGGRLSAKAPAQVVCIRAQPIFSARLYEAEVLRCNRCGKVFTAPLPPEAALEKYDPGVGDMLALLRYGAGLPMYRTAKLQKDFGVPLPASTQWQLMDASAQQHQRVYEALIEAAAQGQILHNDDTHMRVQSLRQQIVQGKTDSERTGIFTTSIVSQVEGHQIGLFFTGQNHAGENLDQLLKRRAATLSAPIHMCDALSRNESKEFETILCNCLVHGRRNFVDVFSNFPEPCRHVIESLGQVYQYEAQAKERQLSAAERLRFHQEHSRPVLDPLHQWMSQQIEEKKVEPNSGLGQAMHYMLRRWDALTRFLSVPGAPLDNNICERALKLVILHRKNSLSYKTERGAAVGDLYMSLIHTCRLNQINPFDYLRALREHAQAVRQDARQWLPWTYRKTLEPADTS
jgi:transposase